MTQPTLTKEFLAELQRGYLAALPGQFDELELLVLAFEKAPSNREAYSNLFRRLHSLKGSAGTYGFHIVTWICHQLEDELTLMDPTNPTIKPDQTNVLLEHVDLLRRTLPALKRGDMEFQNTESDLAKLKTTAPGFSAQILIVDNSNLGRHVCQNALAGLNLKLSLETNGLVALERLLREKFDCLITAYEVGRLNGTALIAANKLSHGINRDIPSILVTSRRDIGTPTKLEPDVVVPKNETWPTAVRAIVERQLPPAQ